MVSGALWFSLMVALSGVLTLIRENSGSLWPGVVAHAVFNLSMNIIIFLFLL
jgi:membrane protease YdiL (CAAX protease family)